MNGLLISAGKDSTMIRKRHTALYSMILPVILSLWTFCSKPMTEEEIQQKAMAVHDRVFTIDTHADTPSRLIRGKFDLGVPHKSGSRQDGKVDLPRMKEGGLDGLFFAVFIGQGERTLEKYNQAKERADRIIDAMEKMAAQYPELVELAYSADDAHRIEKLGKRAAFLGMENGYPLGMDLSRVEHFYNRGIRYITLCHTRNNDLCDSSTDDPEWNGLSPFGERVVREMNRLGMMVDVSHISDSSFYDVLRVSRAPVIASHSSCRAICESPRNLSDGMLKALKENGGVVQICMLNSYLKTDTRRAQRSAALDSLRLKYGSYQEIKDPEIQKRYREAYYALRERFPGPRANVNDLVDHIDHVRAVIGIDHVGIGSDFDGGGGIDGCNDVSEFPNVTIELVRRGYSDGEIEKIWGGNVMRVFREVSETARDLQEL
jgi:membrane dipeptidase